MQPSLQDVMHPPLQDITSPAPIKEIRTPPNKSPNREPLSTTRRAKTLALSAKKELNLFTVNNSKLMSFKKSSHKTVIDSGASTSGTGLRSSLKDLRPTSCSVSAAFGKTAQPFMLHHLCSRPLWSKKWMTPHCFRYLKHVPKDSLASSHPRAVSSSMQKMSSHTCRRAHPVISGKVEEGLYLLDSNWVRPAQLLVTSVKELSIYDHVHRVLGHPGEEGMAWHRQHTIGAHYSNLDASTPRPICAACVQGTMRQTSTDYLRIHRLPSPCYGSQFSLHAYTYIWTYIHKYGCTYVRANVHIRLSLYTCKRTYVYSDINVHV